MGAFSPVPLPDQDGGGDGNTNNNNNVKKKLKMMGISSPNQWSSKFIAVAGLVSIQVFIALVYKLSGRHGKYRFSPASALALAEMVKLVMSFLLFHRHLSTTSSSSYSRLDSSRTDTHQDETGEEIEAIEVDEDQFRKFNANHSNSNSNININNYNNGKNYSRSVSFPETWRSIRSQLTFNFVAETSALALLYLVNNHLVFSLYLKADAATISLFRSGATCLTALLLWLALNRAISQIQWSALFLQVIGLILAQYDAGQDHTKLSYFTYTLLFCSLTLSTVAGIWNERLVKQYNVHLQVQNFTLYIFGSTFNLFGFYIHSAVTHENIGFFSGYNSFAAMGVIVSNAFIGLAITAVYKYGDVVCKQIAGAISTTLLIVLGVTLLHESTNFTAILGCFVVFIGTYLYFTNPPSPAPAVQSSNPTSNLTKSSSNGSSSSLLISSRNLLNRSVTDEIELEVGTENDNDDATFTTDEPQKSRFFSYPQSSYGTVLMGVRAKKRITFVVFIFIFIVIICLSASDSGNDPTKSILEQTDLLAPYKPVGHFGRSVIEEYAPPKQIYVASKFGDLYSSFTVMIPTYSGHEVQIRRFFDSMKKFCSDCHLIRLALIIPTNEVELFVRVQNDYKWDIPGMELHTYTDVFPAFNATLAKSFPDWPESGWSGWSEERLLNSKHKFTFQSLKKLYGCLHLHTQFCYILDSEGFFIRPSSFADLYGGFVKSPYVVYSSWLRPEFFPTIIAERFLGLHGRYGWTLEEYNWIFDTNVLVEVEKKIRETTPTLEAIEQEFFIENVYWVYILRYNHKFPRFRVLDTADIYGIDLYKRITTGLNVTHPDTLGIYEDLRWYMNRDNSLMPDAAEAFNRYEFKIFKTDHTPITSQFLERAKTIVLCISEQPENLYKLAMTGHFV